MKNFKRIFGILLLVITLTATAVLITGCGGGGIAKKPAALDASSIDYDGSTISWNYAENAVKYKVKINGEESETEFTSIAFSTSENTVQVTVTPVGKKNKEGKSGSATFNRLDQITEIRFDENGVASWDAVTGATAYIVEVNGKSEKITSTTYSNFVRGKQNTIRVRPSSTNNSTFSIWSSKVTKTFLAPPTNIDFDGSKITWKGSSEAKSYEIYVDGILVDTVEGSNYYLYDSEERSFDVTMKSIGDGKEVFSSLESEEARFVYLAQVTDFRVESGTISWPEVDDATGYRVKINNNEKTITEPKIENLAAGIDNIIKVMPTANTKGVKYFSNWSAEQKIHILACPTVRWNQSLIHDGLKMNSFEWDPINGVENYEILLVSPNGKSEAIIASKYDDSFAYDYLETGEYSVSIKAVPTSGNGFYESAYSKPVKVIRLAPPTGASTGLVTSNPDSPTPEFDIHIAKDSLTKLYNVYKEGKEIITNHGSTDIKVSNNIVTENVTTAQSFTFSVQAIAANKFETMKDGQMVATLSSLSEQNLSFDISILAVPENLRIESKVLFWDAVHGAFGYKLVGLDAKPNSASHDLSSITEPGSYPIQVFARGDGARVLASPLSSVMNVRKLEAPTNLHVVTSGESEGKIEFDKVDGTKTYQYSFNGNTDYVDQDEFDHVNRYVTETSVSIRVRAVADAFDDAGQVYCITSEFSKNLTLTKLSQPYFPETPHNETHLIWVGSTNITAATPGYHVYDAAGFAYPGTYNDTEFSLESFEPGTYTFTVKAIGDGRNTINSDFSEPVTITKLAKPDVKVDYETHSYTWNFVPNAQRYVVRVNGVIADTIDGADDRTFTFTPKMETFENRQGKHNVTVVAVSDQHVDSSPTLIEQVVKELGDPTFTMTYSDPSGFNPSTGGVIVKVDGEKAPNVNGYVFTVDGITTLPMLDTNEYFHSVKYSGLISASVVAVGGKFDSNGIFYVNSPGVATKTLRILGAPTKSLINLSNQGILTWNPVDLAVLGYEVVITYEDKTTETFTMSQPELVLTRFDKAFANLYEFKIRAVGNGTTLIASEYVEWSQTNRE